MAEPALQVSGRVSKRGLVPRLPASDRLLAELETWFQAEYGNAVRSIRIRTLSPTDGELIVALHPAASDLTIRAVEGGGVTASAALGPAGPGYQTFIAQTLQRLGSEFGIVWDPDGSDAYAGRPGLEAAAERANAESAYLAWLGARLIGARDARRLGVTGIHIGTPAGVAFSGDGAILTSLGPRDDDWLERAIGDSHLAIDVTPWWADATDARYLLNRALCLMWTEVRWRAPIEGERGIHDEVLKLLSRAFPLDPSLPYPWREWHELAGLRGTMDGMTRQVETRAARAPEGPPIGYRRQPVRIVHEGWELEIPGAFAERRSDEEWWGGEAGRSITIAATEIGSGSGPMVPDEFLRQVANDLGPEALSHRSGDLVGRARLSTDDSSGVEVGVLEGYSAIRGRGAAIRVVFDDSADWRWALDIWRALAPSRAASLTTA
jgi:hypothetical protein